MKFFSFLITFVFTVALTVFLHMFSIKVDGNAVPPLGRFFDPFGGFWHNAEKPDFGPTETLQLKGLKNSVEIKYDSSLVPHIFAKNDHDLYLTQGFVTASHRLWQMEFQALAAAGRISEKIGERAFEFDRLKRRKGLNTAATNALKELQKNKDVYNLLLAYTSGVNQFIASLNYKTYPVEYKLLNYKPEKWSPLKTMLLLAYMADDLAGGESDLENTNTLNFLGREKYNFLFPDWFKETDPVIPKGTPWNFKPVETSTPDVEYPIVSTPAITEKPNPDNGSNNWAVSGSKTASGAPILANDPHLNLNLPSIWFMIQLHTPEMNAYGVTIPGSPGIIIGFNESIAWGVTNATRDVKDWYNITFRDEEKNEYLFDKHWLKTQKVVEKIEIKDKDPFFDTIIYTHYGPVTYDESFPEKNNKNNYAMKWTAHNPGNELFSLIQLNRAKNYHEFQKAIESWSTPAQNFVFASVSGDIALTVQGRFPLKWKEQGKFLMDGSMSSFEWKEYIPNEHQAKVLNPPRGFVSSANQYPADSTYPYYIYDDNYEWFRNRQINRRLSEMKNISVADMMKLQNDNFNLQAFESLPMMMDSLNVADMSTLEKELFEELRKWNFQNETSEKGASIYAVWWSNFYNLLWDELEKEEIPLRKPDANNTIRLVKEFPQNEFIDVVSTPEKEKLADLFRNSFKTAADSLNKWKQETGKGYSWGQFKGSSIVHLALIPQFSVMDIATNGAKHSINALGKRHGPSWRMVVELGKEVKAWGIYPGGQSGNPGSKYYDNFIEKWQEGHYLRLHFLKNNTDNRDKMLFTQTFEPQAE